MIEPVQERGLTLKNRDPELRLDEEKFACLSNAISAANAEEYGVRLGFLGNEQYSSEQNES